MEYGGGIETFVDCIVNRDPVWVEAAYLSIVRRHQMEELRTIPEDEWPDKASLQEYDPIYPEDINFYEPVDLLPKLGMWLRDHRIRQRKEQVRLKNQQKAQQITNQFG